jgi:ABC-type uncharacterized transport system auxiliary subunit
METDPRSPRRRGRLGLLALAALATGCLSKPDVEPVRYFSPGPPPPAPAAAQAARPPSPLWLRRVTSAGHLDHRMARRTSDVEIGFNDLERWTDPPALLVERALVHELFEALGVERADAGRTPRLDVHVLAFEERIVPDHAAAVTIVASLFDGRDLSILERTFTATSALDTSDPAVVARAMGLAMGEAVRAAATTVVGALGKR